MKKILLVVSCIVALSNCSVVKPIMYSEVAYVGDFRQYSAEGFTIATSSAGFEYEPVSLIQIEATAGYVEKYRLEQDAQTGGEVAGFRSPFEKSGRAGDDMYSGDQKRPMNTRNMIWVNPDFDQLTRQLVEKAKSMGANGLFDFKISSTTNTPPLKYVASGFAVKIKK